jgi:two-component system nitrate/nitrite response regulator NarL
MLIRTITIEMMIAAAPRALPQRVRVLIADDHPVFRHGLRCLLESQQDFHVIGEANDGAEAVVLASKLRPDLALLGLGMPGASGLEALKELSSSRLRVRSIMLAAVMDREQVVKALQLGAYGVLLKSSPAEMTLKGLRAVMAGQHWVDRQTITNIVETLREFTRAPAVGRCDLTVRQHQIVSCVANGLTNRDIATKLGISEDTVKHHLTQIFTRTGTTNRLELAVFALQHQLGGDA